MQLDQIREALEQRAAVVDFDADRHLYWWGEQCLPSVTSVLEYAGFTNHEFACPEARDRGSRVHSAIADMEAYGLTAEEAAEILPEDERGYLQTYATFKAETGFQVIASEQRVLGEVPSVFLNSQIYYAGTADLIGVMDEQIAVVDFKTSAKLQKHVGYQLAGYSMALQLPQALRFGLRLDRSGEYSNKTHLREYGHAADGAYFSSALIVMHGRRGRNFYRPLEAQMKIIDTSGNAARIKFPYDEALTQLMRDLGLSRYWVKAEKAYVVPLEEADTALDDETISRLEAEGFQVC